jgi:glycosyltransferase involved in cell wall biosynthesis
MQSSLTSVVIPAYNRAGYLPATVESALRQEGAEVEVIVVDDGSTDDTAAVVERQRAAWGERFRYVRQENAERCVARNHGLRLARGEFVAFLDSDDLWRPNHVRACLDALQKNTSAAAVYADHGLVDAEGRVIREHVTSTPLIGDRFKRELCLKRLILFPAEVVVRRSALDAAYGSADVFDPEAVMLEEWLVWVTLLRGDSTFERVGEPTVWRRLHPDSTWGNPEKFARQSVLATEKVINTGLPHSLGIPARRIRAINFTHCAYGFYLAGEWPRARGFLASALKEYPLVLRELHFWRIAARLCLGRRLTRAVRAARHKGRGEFVGAQARTQADL